MKHFINYASIILLIVLTGCFLDPEKKNNNNLLLLALLNPSDKPVTIQSTYYEDDGTLMIYMETVYPSSGVYIDSLNVDKELQSIYPTFSDMFNLTNGWTLSKWSGGIGTDGIWFTDDDDFMQNDALVTVSSSVFRYITYEDFNDTVSAYFEYQLDTEGRIVKRTYFNGKGSDNAWFTPDDVKAVDSDSVCILETSWSDVNHAASIGYGTDGTTIVKRYSVSRDNGTKEICYKNFQSNGTTQISAVAFDYTNYRRVFYSTDMSTVTQYYDDTVGPAPLHEYISSSFYMGDGDDDDWFTGDDDLFAYTESTYDEDGYKTGAQTYSDAAKTTRLSYSVITHE
jgi:hypothetical protein